MVAPGSRNATSPNKIPSTPRGGTGTLDLPAHPGTCTQLSGSVTIGGTKNRWCEKRDHSVAICSPLRGSLRSIRGGFAIPSRFSERTGPGGRRTWWAARCGNSGAFDRRTARRADCRSQPYGKGRTRRLGRDRCFGWALLFASSVLVDTAGSQLGAGGSPRSARPSPASGRSWR